MAFSVRVQKFNQLASACTQFSPDELLLKPEWGAINFAGCYKEFSRLVEILNYFKTLPIDDLPDNIIDGFTGQLEGVFEFINKINNFSIMGQANPSETRDDLVHNLKNKADTFFLVSQTYMPYLSFRAGNMQRNIDEIKQNSDTAKLLFDDLVNSISKRNTEIDGIMTAARDASASVGIAHFTADFSTEAEANKKQGYRWLAATILASLITILAATIMMYRPLPHDVTIAQLIQLFTSKVVLLAILFSATIWCGRLYKASKHLETLNKHRSNSLKTFQAFVKAASDESSRNAVLMETTRSIFTIAPSGYLDSSDVSSDGGMKIVEVIKNISQAGK